MMAVYQLQQSYIAEYIGPWRLAEGFNFKEVELGAKFNQ